MLVKGTNATFRSVAYSDLAEDGAISIEDGQPDPDVEGLDIDYVEFTGTKKGRTVGLTDNAQERSPPISPRPPWTRSRETSRSPWTTSSRRCTRPPRPSCSAAVVRR